MDTIDTIDTIKPENTFLGTTNTTALRRQEVTYYLLNGLPTDELAVKYGSSIETIQHDITVIRSWWRKQAGRAINDMQEQELQFAYLSRKEVLDTWHETKRPQFMNLVLEWTKRIAELLGLDQPTKNLNVNVSYDEYARDQGVGKRDLATALVQEVANLIKTTNLSPEDLQPLVDALAEAQTKDVTPVSDL